MVTTSPENPVRNRALVSHPRTSETAPSSYSIMMPGGRSRWAAVLGQATDHPLRHRHRQRRRLRLRPLPCQLLPHQCSRSLRMGSPKPELMAWMWTAPAGTPHRLGRWQPPEWRSCPNGRHQKFRRRGPRIARHRLPGAATCCLRDGRLQQVAGGVSSDHCGEFASAV